MMSFGFCEVVLVARDEALKHIRRKRLKPPEPDQTAMNLRNHAMLMRWGHMSCVERTAVANYISRTSVALNERGLDDQFYCIAQRDDGTIEEFGRDKDNAFRLRVVCDLMFEIPS